MIPGTRRASALLAEGMNGCSSGPLIWARKRGYSAGMNNDYV